MYKNSSILPFLTIEIVVVHICNISWLKGASLIVIFFLFSALFTFLIMSLSRRRRIKRRRVGGGFTGHATIIKTETGEISISILLLHQSLFIKMSNSFFKRFNVRTFFSLGGNGRVRGLQVQVSTNFLYGLSVFASCTPFMLIIF
jgi:hypothetical protein